MIKGKTPEEIRKLFNIVNDFTPEEEVSDPDTAHLYGWGLTIDCIFRPR